MQFKDEIGGNLSNHEDVMAPRLEDMKQLIPHEVYDEVPAEECCKSVGRALVKVKWVDINKGDDVNHEYQSRSVPEEIKTDKRPDLFAATPPPVPSRYSSVQLPLRAWDSTDSDEEPGMKSDSVDSS